MGVAGPTVKTSFRVPPYLSVPGAVVVGSAVVLVGGAVVLVGSVVGAVDEGVVVAAGVVVSGVGSSGSPQADNTRPSSRITAAKIHIVFFI
jgi:hypothetical protein